MPLITSNEDETMTDKIEDGGPAFPVPDEGQGWGSAGMTMRDWFAGQIAPTIDADEISERDLKGLFGPTRTNIRKEEIVAAMAYRVADAMLAARKA